MIFEAKRPSHRRGDVNRMKALMDRRGWAQGEVALLSIIATTTTIPNTTAIITTITTTTMTMMMTNSTTIINTAAASSSLLEPLIQRSRWHFLKTEEAIKWSPKTIRINQHQWHHYSLTVTKLNWNQNEDLGESLTKIHDSWWRIASKLPHFHQITIFIIIGILFWSPSSSFSPFVRNMILLYVIH